MAGRCCNRRDGGLTHMVLSVFHARAPVRLLIRACGRLTLMIVLVLSQAAAAVPQLNAAERWVVLAARRDGADATHLARVFARDLRDVFVVKARNGWHAVIAGPIAARSIAEAKAHVPDHFVLPTDAYLASGEGFDMVIFTAPTPVARKVIEFDGETPVSYRFDTITITLGSDPAERGLRMPTLIGKAGERLLFATRFDDNPTDAPRSTARVIRLDPTTPLPQIIFSTYTGGAHCCTATRIVTQDPAGGWQVLDAGTVDGEGYALEDVDDDSYVELLGVDNSFLYAFASYAESYAPPVVMRVSGGQLRTVTQTESILPYLRRNLREMELSAADSPGLWTNKGFLAGWVAAKAQLGEVESAWPRVLAAPTEPDAFLMRPCTENLSANECPPGQRRQRSFAEALREHLRRNGYPVPALADAATADDARGR